MKMLQKVQEIVLRTIRSLAVGLSVGVCITFFANTVSWAGVVNSAFPFLIILIPIGAWITLEIYKKLGAIFRRTTISAIDVIHDMEETGDESKLRRGRISPWMAPVAYIAAAISHITGASVGKEGVGVQIGLSVGELIDRIDKRLSWHGHHGREDYYMMTASAAAFGSLFGSPISGVLFGLMFATPDILRLDALFPCLVSSYSAVYIAELLHIHRMVIPAFTELEATLPNLAWIIAFGLLIGLLSRLFLHLLKHFRDAIAKFYSNSVMSAIVPATLVMLLSFIVYGFTKAFDYNGLSLNLLYRAIDGRGVPYYAFIIKAMMVFLSISAGFAGGEVVPLLVTGGTFGYAFASIFSLQTAPFAVLGAIGMLTGGTNLPLVCFALALELFGYSEPVLLFMAVAASYIASGDGSIYHHQRIALRRRLNQGPSRSTS